VGYFLLAAFVSPMLAGCGVFSGGGFWSVAHLLRQGYLLSSDYLGCSWLLFC